MIGIENWAGSSLRLRKETSLANGGVRLGPRGYRQKLTGTPWVE